MSTTIDVQIVRPKQSAWVLLFAAVFRAAVGAAVVMLLLPIVTPWSLSYLQSMAAYYLVQTLVGQGDYVLWSKAATR